MKVEFIKSRYQEIKRLITRESAPPSLPDRAPEPKDGGSYVLGDAVGEYVSKPTVTYAPKAITREDCIDYPLIVTIETLASCNAACTFCTYPTLERKHTRLPTEKVYEILDELKNIPQKFNLQFTGMSEAFVDKRAPDFFRYATENIPNASITIYTNGNLLNRKNREWVCGLPVRHLSVSLNETSPERYREVMDLDFQQTIDNLVALHEEYSPDRTRVDVTRVGDDSELDRAFLDFAAERFPRFNAVCVKPFGWLSRPDDPTMEEQDYGSLPCKQWFSARVLADGKVTLCNQDDEGRYSHGNVHDDSLLGIYRGNHFRDARINLLPRRDLPFPCNKCECTRQGLLPF